MKVMIAGAGSVGRSIAQDMVARKYDVVIVDRNPHAMRVASVPSADWILGDACEPSVLEQVGLENTDVVVTATGDDKANLVVSLLSKTEYGVPRVIARINNPANEWLFNETWGVDVPVSTPHIMTNLIEEAVTAGAFTRKFSLPQSDAAIYQGVVSSHAPVVGVAVGDIALPPDSFISAIIRDGVNIRPDFDVVLDAGDQILLLSWYSGGLDTKEANKLIAPMAHEVITEATGEPA